jgi:methylenetetrahydrofolate reductase (NADPH)
MPILNASQIRRITSLCGATIPAGLDRQLERHSDDNRAVRQIGIDHTLRQAQELMASDVPGIHFYVLNRRYSITKILDNLQGSSVGVTSS